MDLERRNGRWRLRWREGGRRRSRTLDRKGGAQDYIAWLRRRQQLGHAAVPDDVKLAEFVETYWRLHAVPNLSQSTRDLYSGVWERHMLPALGDYGVRELTPKRLTRFRADLEQAGVGTATVVKALTIVQSILTFAVSEEVVEYNAAAAVRKPRYTRDREPHIFFPLRLSRSEGSWRRATGRSSRCWPTRAHALRRSCAGWRGAKWETRASATSIPNATGSGTRHCSRRSPRTCANGSWPQVAPRAGHPCFRRTTAASGIRMTGATGASAYGLVSQSVNALTGPDRPHHGSAAPRPARAHATCAPAT
jgi:hypothetical protein